MGLHVPESEWRRGPLGGFKWQIYAFILAVGERGVAASHIERHYELVQRRKVTEALSALLAEREITVENGVYRPTPPDEQEWLIVIELPPEGLASTPRQKRARHR